MSGLEELFVNVVGENPVWQGLAAGVVIAFLNLIGALFILVIRNPSRRLLDILLAFAGGVMIAASFTSLILPGIEQYGGLFSVGVGFVLGGLFLDQSGRWMPYVYHFITGRAKRNGGSESPSPSGEAMGAVAGGSAGGLAGLDRKTMGAILLILAVTIHNMPEGLAVGVGFGSGNIGNAIALMLAIGIQNIPEGFACAVGAKEAGLGRGFYPALTGIRAGAVEIPIAVLGAALVVIFAPVLPYAMGFAAGGMIYVVSREIIPEVQSHGNQRLATLGLLVGLLVMLSLDIALA